MEVQFDTKILLTVVVIVFLGVLVRLYNGLVVKPKRLRSILKKQGINGPPPTFLLGNIREIKKVQSSAVKAHSSNDPPLIHNCAALFFHFLSYGGRNMGILTSNGAFWSHQRRILAPELYMEKVKGMVNLITESTITLINSWKSMIETDGGIADIKIDEDLRNFSADVISRACFGSNYSRGEKIFQKLRNLQNAMSKKVLATGIPGMRYLPTKSNREVWALEKDIRYLILEVVKERQEGAYEKDLLQMILESAKTSNLNREATDQFIVDNAKNIYLAGFETTAVSATWCLMLLAVNQEWQDRIRAEVLEICGGGMPDSDMIRKMKLLNMVIQETLRLYSPVPVVSREAFKNMKFGNINVPKGVNIWTMVLPLHTHPEIWGSDSYKFNPERFANGIAGACKYPFLYMPFGVGPRVCLGQNLAMVELKILIALLLSNFSFSISPKYIHSLL
ncbi:hypothetical protein GH714_011013 [Hevea brasiliensis]|uniref:Cytochrome P450 n=1 Tax=Hevea brasiliensis TaxID=3981 RepID=A0A6A6KMZ2_HEVBR|nr:hypothetical protein GH714_011013 [Hevea brasiliensis]